MAGKVIVDKSEDTDDYEVSGSTLAEIWEDIKAKGPKDGGKDRAGYTTCTATTPKSAAFDGKVEPSKAKPGEQQASVWFKNAKMPLTCKIQLPKLKSDKGLSDAAKKEWKRFLAGVKKHEKEHVAESLKEAKKIAGELAALTGVGTDKDKAKAIKAAQADHAKKEKKDYSKAKLTERMDKVNKALDAGGHGPVLDLSIK